MQTTIQAGTISRKLRNSPRFMQRLLTYATYRALKADVKHMDRYYNAVLRAERLLWAAKIPVTAR